MESKNTSDLAETISPEDDLAEVQALFVRQVRAENDHDLAAIAEILIEEASVGPSQAVFVARVGRFFGRDTVLQRFENNFRGIWKFEPDMAEFYAAHLSADAIFVSVPTSVTMGPAGETPRTGRFLVNQVAVPLQSRMAFRCDRAGSDGLKVGSDRPGDYDLIPRSAPPSARAGSSARMRSGRSGP